MKIFHKLKNTKPFKALANIPKEPSLGISLAALIVLTVACVQVANNNQPSHELQSTGQADTSQLLTGDKLFEITTEQKKDLDNARPVSGETGNPSKAPTDSNEPPTTIPETTPNPDYSSLTISIESIQKNTVYLNGQPKTVYDLFGQVTYPSGPSLDSVQNGDCKLRLHKLGRGAEGDFTLTAESQGNSYGPTCQFQAEVGRAGLTTGSWVATMTYTTQDGLGEVTAYKGFVVD